MNRTAAADTVGVTSEALGDKEPESTDAVVSFDSTTRARCQPDESVFDAELQYAAADLERLASEAPLHKRDPLLAIVGLVRSLAVR